MDSDDEDDSEEDDDECVFFLNVYLWVHNILMLSFFFLSL